MTGTIHAKIDLLKALDAALIGREATNNGVKIYFNGAWAWFHTRFVSVSALFFHNHHALDINLASHNLTGIEASPDGVNRLSGNSSNDGVNLEPGRMYFS